MKKLPILNQEENYSEHDLKEISLKDRPSFDFAGNKFEEIRTKLSTDVSERIRFVEDPVSYLKHHSLPISSGKFVIEEIPMQSELVSSAVVVFVAAVLLYTVAAAATVAAVSALVWNTAWVLDGQESSGEHPNISNIMGSSDAVL